MRLNLFFKRILGLDRYEEFYTSTISWDKEVPPLIQQVVDRFENNLSFLVMQTNGLRYLDSGYFIRLDLTHGEEKEDVLKFASELTANFKTYLIHHNHLTNKKINNLINVVRDDLYHDPPANIPSFWVELNNVVPFIAKKFKKILYDEPLFINESVIFAFYEEGMDINFTHDSDRQEFISRLKSGGYKIAKYPGYDRCHFDMYSKNPPNFPDIK